MNFSLSIELGSGSRSDITGGYAQCRVLRSLQHVHVKLSQIMMSGRAGKRSNVTYKLFVQRRQRLS